MLDKGIYGAFMHARAGIDSSETPYFSDGWWKAVNTMVKYGGEKGFMACLYDEDKWPSRSAGGSTISVNPAEFSKKGLQYVITDFQSGENVSLDPVDTVLAAFAIPVDGLGNTDLERFVDLTSLAYKY